MLWVILASGPSMNQELADYVRGKAKVIAVSDTFRLAPWADALVSNDRHWWEVNEDAQGFAGLKFCSHALRDVEEFRQHVHIGRNSGLMAMFVAKNLGASKIALCGFDMQGSHFFGPHTGTLKNTSEKMFRTHIRQFDGFSGCEVVNCTQGSRLTRFPFARIEEIV